MGIDCLDVRVAHITQLEPRNRWPKFAACALHELGRSHVPPEQAKGGRLGRTQKSVPAKSVAGESQPLVYLATCGPIAGCVAVISAGDLNQVFAARNLSGDLIGRLLPRVAAAYHNPHNHVRCRCDEHCVLFRDFLPCLVRGA